MTTPKAKVSPCGQTDATRQISAFSRADEQLLLWRQPVLEVFRL
jgi:hypothetical protein